MVEALENPVSQPASLEFEGGVCLAGELSLNETQQLQLGSARLLSGPDGGDKVRLRPGMIANLVISRGDLPEEPLRVNISGIVGDKLGLQFLDPDCDAARHCRNLLTPNTRKGDDSAITGATAEYSRILQELQQYSLGQLETVLQPAMKELSGYLLELSARLKPGKDGRNPHYEAAVTVRRHGDVMINDLLDQVFEFYHNLSPGEEDQYWHQHSDNPDDLGLIDIKEFEGFLAIDRMVTLGEDLHKIPLEALQIRLAVLIGEAPTQVRLPVHVRQICRGFQRALDSQDLPHEVISHIFDHFAKHIIRNLGDYYRPLNRYLADCGIEPDLEQRIRSKGTLLKRKSKIHHPKRPPSRPKNSQTLGAEATGQGENEGLGPGPSLSEMAAALGTRPTATSFSPQNLYRSVVDALNFKREAQGLIDGNVIAAGTPVSGTWDGATVPSSEVDQESLADAQAIASALSGMQRDSRIQQAIQESPSLREYLSLNKESIRAIRDSSGLTADSLNQLDLVDNLFGTIKSQVDVTSELQPALGNLQIPLAKLALLDSQFFMDRGHAAREVVDKLSHLATSANFPNKTLETRISAVVDEIVTDYEHDSAVFDRALKKLDALVAQQERALTRNIERVVRIQEGQEKLGQARDTVDRIIAERIQPPAAPRVLLDLVKSGWRDLLVLCHVKEGPDSTAWDEHIKTLDQLTLWLNQQLSGDVDEDLTMERGLEAETLIDMIEQQITTALPTNVSHQVVLEELRDILSGAQEVETAEVTEGLAVTATDKSAKTRSRVEDLPRLRRWVHRVEQLEKGSWLSYQNKDGQRRRMQLAWISAGKDRYIFVNERGQKVADLSSVQLARKLSRGLQPPAPADKLSVVDQSMYQTLEHVQKTLSFARNHDSLTKLINKETFLEQMGKALRHSQLKDSQHCVLYLDIDQFSLVNEVYDKVNGDQVLLEFSKLLAQLHGKKSSSARIEGDGFAVLLLDRSMEQGLQIAEKIRSDIASSSVDIEAESVTFTVSIGAAPILEHSPTVDDVLEAARMATRKAKELGRNQVQVYEEDQALAGAYRQEKSRALESVEQALATDRFVLRAQPIVQTTIGGAKVGGRHYELLLGISNADGSLSSPAEFIESAERYGFMNLVDRWVVREAFSWISRLMDEQKEVPHLAINLSGTSVTDDSFMEYLLEQISEFGVGTSRVCFEITETGTISNLVKAADFVRAFRNIGCKFSIDDFGTGLASHNYLRELPVDYVKIDGTFITAIDKNRHDYAMARSINDLAHFLGQETIAESVENDNIVEKLQEIGVDYLQGWGVGKPKPLLEVTEDLSNLEK